MHDLVSFVIPNWNGQHFLEQCLNSIISQSYNSFEIIVVDNGSKDNSCEFITNNYPTVKLIRFENNTGFSVAVNRGIIESSGKYIALINNDTKLDINWLKYCLEAINQNPDCASVACKMLMFNDPKYIDGVGDGYRIGGLPGRIGNRLKDTGQYNTPRYILGACGGAALYKKEALVKVGLFDEDYFAYLEDVDIALRLQSYGYKAIYTPWAVLYHVGCGTTGSGYSNLVVRLTTQNIILTILKNFSLSTIVRFAPQIIYCQLYYLAAVIIYGRNLIPWFTGYLNALKLLTKILPKRKKILQNRTISNKEFEKIILTSQIELEQARAQLNVQKLARHELFVGNK